MTTTDTLHVAQTVDVEDYIGGYGASTPAAYRLFSDWVNHAALGATRRVRPDAEWVRLFGQHGRHLVRVQGYVEEWHDALYTDEWLEVAHGGVTSVTAAGPRLSGIFEPPAHLYRAARPGDENGLMWFDRFDLARLFADSRGGTKIYTAEIDKLLGKVEIHRTEASGHREQWNEWIVKPKNVREINRWRDPFTDVPNLESWQKQGVHVVEAASTLNAWLKYHEGKQAPMDREQGGYWLSQFQRLGQFEGWTYDDYNDLTASRIDIAPVGELNPPAVLYRGSSERLKARWSWTDSLETARGFVKHFAPSDGKVWVCQPREVFGVIHCHIDNAPREQDGLNTFSEWIVDPDGSTIKEWHPAG